MTHRIMPNVEVFAIDSVYTQFTDNEGLKALVMRATAEELWSKMFINLNQIDNVNTVFSPNE